MEANKLRLGNLVYWNREREKQKSEIVEIYYIRRSTVRCYTDIEELDEVLLNYDELQPIPLTEEMLLKAGFEKNENPEIYRLNAFVISDQSKFLVFYIIKDEIHDEYSSFNFIYSSSNIIDTSHIVSIQYLHQLQNLYFALTGEELNINL